MLQSYTLQVQVNRTFRKIAHDLSVENNDLTSDLRLATDNKYSQVRIFEGVSMVISAKVQSTLQKLMPSRLPVDNMDKVSRILSSSICENGFETLPKHAEGKRIGMHEMGNWVVLKIFIAGLRSNVDCCRNLILELGVCKNKLLREIKEKQ